MRNPTGSQMGLLAKCLGPFILPRVDRVHSATDRGTVIHAYLADAVRFGREKALASVPTQWREECAGVEVPTFPADARIECALAYHATNDSARHLGDDIGRGYDLRPGEIAATADAMFFDAEGPAVVVDFKTGRTDVEPPATNWQMRTLALAAARFWNLDAVEVQIWKLKDDGGWWRDSHVFDALDLDGFAAAIRDRLRALDRARERFRDGQQPDLVAGEHCRWCASAHACPAQTALIKAAAGTTGELATAEDAGRAYALLVPLRDLVEKFEREIKQWAEREPIPLPDGRTLALEATSKEFVTGAVAEKVIREMHGEEVARRCVEHKITASKEAIRRELGKAAKDTINAIRDAGGVKVSTSTRLVAK